LCTLLVVLSGLNARIWTVQAHVQPRRLPLLPGRSSTDRNRSCTGVALHHQSHGSGIWLARAVEIWLQPRGLVSRPRSHGTRTEALPRYGSKLKTLKTRGGTPADFDSIWNMEARLALPAQLGQGTQYGGERIRHSQIPTQFTGKGWCSRRPIHTPHTHAVHSQSKTRTRSRSTHTHRPEKRTQNQQTDDGGSPSALGSRRRRSEQKATCGVSGKTRNLLISCSPRDCRLKHAI
jgi:hypothetical protein